MADTAANYVLATAGGTVSFNTGVVGDGTDVFFITKVRGLDGHPLRTPIDNAPQAPGGIVHDFWPGPRHPAFEGVFLIQSTRVGTSCQTIRNQMEADLLAALESIEQKSVASGTLTWTPVGQGARSLSVQSEIPMETDGDELKTFTFGLVAANPAW